MADEERDSTISLDTHFGESYLSIADIIAKLQSKMESGYKTFYIEADISVHGDRNIWMECFK